MCKMIYDSVQDIFQVLERKYDAKKVDFFQLFKDSPFYVISEGDKIIGLELIGFKDFTADFFKEKKKELRIENKRQAEEFVKGNLYNLFKTELSGSKVVREERKEVIVFNPAAVVKNNIREFCSV